MVDNDKFFKENLDRKIAGVAEEQMNLRSVGRVCGEFGDKI
jgi:hypothetical protein